MSSLPQNWETSVSRFPASVTSYSLKLCAQHGDWERGAGIASGIVQPDSLERREAAGRFYLAQMEAMAAAGDSEGARRAGHLLCRIWPEGRALCAKFLPE